MKVLKKICYIGGVLLVVSLINEPLKVNADSPDPDYYPMAVGNYWVYEFYDLPSDSAEIGTLRILSDTTLEDGKSAYLFQDMEGDSGCFIADTVEIIGLWGVRSLSDITSHGALGYYIRLLQYPLDIEGINSWEGGGGDNPIYVQVVGEDTVEVPAGTFYAYEIRYTFTADTAVMTVWYAPYVGPVKQEAITGINIYPREFELLSYGTQY